MPLSHIFRSYSIEVRKVFSPRKAETDPLHHPHTSAYPHILLMTYFLQHFLLLGGGPVGKDANLSNLLKKKKKKPLWYCP